MTESGLIKPPDRIDLPFTVLNVSYSKAQSFKTCKFKFEQAFVVMQNPQAKKPGLMPKKKGHALARGTHGHAIMQRFMEAMKSKEFPYDQAVCQEEIGKAVAWGIMEDSELAMEVSQQIMHFGANVFPYKYWRILEVEKEYRLPIGVDPNTGIQIVVPLTIDLVAEEYGEVIVVDWKFSADAYSDTRCEIEAQIPIYIGVLRAFGIKARRGYYGFFRTRKNMKNIEERVVIKPVKPNDIRVKQSFREHLVTAKEIHEFQSLGSSATRNPNNNCDYCDFNRLCAVSLRGDDTSVMIEADFEPNDYGYEDE